MRLKEIASFTIDEIVERISLQEDEIEELKKQVKDLESDNEDLEYEIKNIRDRSET